MYRTHRCGDVNESLLGQEIKLAGWVSNIRDHGGILFVDLRDHYGMVQLKVEDDSMVVGLSKESVISVTGTVISRDPSSYNEKLESGKVEIQISKIEVLNKSKNALPFEIMESRNVSEDLRLKYRYLDLRNPQMQRIMKVRSDLLYDLRTWMREMDFEEFQTPILSASSPEGARDYLVPSRNYPGKFYALPQAPQQFKQLLMCSGMDRYFQIAPCFRDEDARADRSPGEFYQLDIEMAFATQEDVFKVTENVLIKAFQKYGKYELKNEPFVRIPYREAMVKYGTDKPDLRNPLILKDLTETFKDTTFGAFKNRTVRGFALDCSAQPRSFFDDLTKFMLDNGAGGLAWVRVLEDGSLKGPIIKFISEEEQKKMVEVTGAKVGDDIFVIADEERMCNKLAGLLRTEVARKMDMIEKNCYKFCWIVDFPMFELNKEGKIDFAHNPFSMPAGGLDALNNQDIFSINANQYDIVVNGIELSSGAERNNDIEIMKKAFELVGYDQSVLESKFGALYTAFQYGAPPHAGIAPGVDRMLMLLLDEESIREIVTFPMNAKAQDLLMNAPSEVSIQQLRDVHIKINSSKVLPQ